MIINLTKGVQVNITRRTALMMFVKQAKEHDVRFLREAPIGLKIKVSLTDKPARRYVEKLFDRAAVDYSRNIDARRRVIVWTKK